MKEFSKKKVGLIGWRGMVGSVLIKRMEEEGDFKLIDPFFFSTTQKGKKAPSLSVEENLGDAFDLSSLEEMDIILTCQGGDYTESIHPQLRKRGWEGFWIDASSSLRMKDKSCLILDPLNRELIEQSLSQGIRDYIGANCTVSLMLLALAGPLREGIIEWINSSTYQAASGAGAKNMRELLDQMGHLYKSANRCVKKGEGHFSFPELENETLMMDSLLTEQLQSPQSTLPKKYFQVPLAGSLIPWIDREMDNGQTREEWKGMNEANKILSLKEKGERKNLPIDGTCVRIGAMRSHSQALTLKLKKDLDLKEFERLLKQGHQWIEFIPNTKKETIKKLTPAYFSGTLKIGVGRVRAMNLGPQFVNLFTVGDQLLWGAAEPLRRFLRILLSQLH